MLAGSRIRVIALVALTVLVAVSGGCGGDDDDAGGGGDEPTTSTGGAEATPQRGGRLVYGLEGESSGGFCLPEAQLAISGIQVARTVYDTLTAPNAEGEYVPFLAESVEPDAELDLWTVTLRAGVKFHDGTDLTAEVVKNNFDAYRGAYAARSPLLFVFVYENIAEVRVVDDLTLEFATKTPWPAFPAYLYSSGRVGILAQAQLDDTESCDKKMIGTGPFSLKEWKVNDKLVAVANPDYWQTDAAGERLPYLDEIEYRPIVEGDQRVNALQGGQIGALHISEPLHTATLDGLAVDGGATVMSTTDFTEVGYALFNAGQPPFDNILARRAVAYAIDRDQWNQVRNGGLLTNASGPFAPGNMGYLEDAGFPEYDLDRAKELVAQYEAEAGRPLEFTLSATPDVLSVEDSQLFAQMCEAAGIKVSLRHSEQAQLINEAIGGEYQVHLWRNHPGGDPDEQYIWWHSGSIVNFGRIADPEVDRLLEAGRVETDLQARTAVYEDLNRRFADQVHNLWLQWTQWTVATAPDVHGVLGPDLPDGSTPFTGLATGHPVSTIWIG